jgi:glycerol-3-phosphate dehydrogenase
MMPWLNSRRPFWLIRLGLFCYDTLGGRKILPPTKSLNLENSEEGAPLKAKFKRALEYSDCWVEDSRLVILNARDAQKRGATILPRVKLIAAERGDKYWILSLQDQITGQKWQQDARYLVNAAGPWVQDILGETLRLNVADSVRLVRGSHLVVKRQYEHDKAYFFQGKDGRIIFAIPYEQDFTLIGTTDVDHDAVYTNPICTDEEQEYLLKFASEYFKNPITSDDINWRYSGVRPLYEDGANAAASATRDYVLRVDSSSAPIVTIFGGKITTYRKLAESALRKITPFFELPDKPWTAHTALPGGDFEVAEFA